MSRHVLACGVQASIELLLYHHGVRPHRELECLAQEYGATLREVQTQKTLSEIHVGLVCSSHHL